MCWPSFRYLLLPALLGDLTLQVTEGNRLETIRRARVYLLDYLQRCKSYAITAEVGRYLAFFYWYSFGFDSQQLSAFYFALFYLKPSNMRFILCISTYTNSNPSHMSALSHHAHTLGSHEQLMNHISLKYMFACR